MRLLLFAFLLCLPCLLPAGHGQTPAASPVEVTGGYISGVTVADSIQVYKGIPFAAPPVGAFRWRAPQPVAPWRGVRACTKFGPSPVQGKPVPFSMWSKEFLIPDAPIGEDCLYLNVWSAARAAEEKRAVIVWIYGGGFQSGGAGVPIYDGEAMAKKGIVFVSINYRVGTLGFFAHPDLSRESGHNASGNWGLLDQIAALQWVQKNIAAFGGDPDNVTVAGQSAGSMSVNALVASPLAAGLFHRAIGESGANFSDGNARLAQAEEEGAKGAEALHLTIDQLRKLSADDILKKLGGTRAPIIDGYVLPEPIVTLFRENKENKVDLLTGWNQDEGFVFGPSKTAAAFRQYAAGEFGADSTEALRYYPAHNDAEAAASELALSRDMIFGAQNFAWATEQARQSTKVFVYRFLRKPPATGAYVKFGAFHTGEVPYAYNNLAFVDRPWQPIDRELAEIMSSYWANFAKTGDPNAPNLPVWDPFVAPAQKVMLLGESPASVDLPDAAQLEFVHRESLRKSARNAAGSGK